MDIEFHAGLRSIMETNYINSKKHRRQILTSKVNPRADIVIIYIVTLAHDIGNQMKQKELTKLFINIAFKLKKSL